MYFVLFSVLLLLSTASTTHTYNVGLLVSATGKYIEFVPNLIASAQKYFLSNHNVTYFIFTDFPIQSIGSIVIVPATKLPWPYATLNRTQFYYDSRALFAKMDYLFACDSDMLFFNTVGDEIIGSLVGTTHPQFATMGAPYETNPISQAYVAPHEGSTYYAGGFYGGSQDRFLDLCKSIIHQSTIDQQNGYIAVWHDESYLNRYFIDFPPQKILPCAYCHPDEDTISQYPYLHHTNEPKIIALTKIHTDYRK